MSGDYHRIRALLLAAEHERLSEIDSALRHTDERFDDLASALAESLERASGTQAAPRLTRALADLTADSLGLAISKRPGAIVQALFPIIGPAIRRALAEALRGIAHDLDQSVKAAFSLKALRWRMEAWRTGTPYAHVVMRHRFKYRVEHLFLIQCDSGLLLDHVSTLDVAEIDVDAIAGMLTAIEHFVLDSMAATHSGLGEATVGEYRLLVNHGPHARLAAFLRGIAPSGLSDRLGALIEDLHASHGESLVGAPGARREPLLPADVLSELNQHESDREQESDASRSTFTVPILLAVLLASVAGFLWWADSRWRHEAETIREELTAIPGVVLLESNAGTRNALRVHGMYDARSGDPRQLISRRHPSVVFDWLLHPYLSADPEVIASRVRRDLALPAAVAIRQDAGGTVHLSGSVPFSTWYRASTYASPGVERVDVEGLMYPGKRQIQESIEKIEKLRVENSSGTDLTPPGAARKQELLSLIDALLAQSAKHGVGLQLRVFGFTDEPGSPSMNRELRLRRAELLGEAIRERTQGRLVADVAPETLFAGEFHGRLRAAAVRVSIRPQSATSTAPPMAEGAASP